MKNTMNMKSEVNKEVEIIVEDKSNPFKQENIEMNLKTF